MTYFTDENISEHLARVLGHFDRRCTVVPSIDRFAKGTPDQVWIPALAAWDPKPVAVLGDGRVLRNPVLKAVAKEADLTFMVLGESFMRTAWRDQAWKLVKAWPDIVKETSAARRATIFDLSISSLNVQARHATGDLR